MTNVDTALLAFVERIERNAEERQALAEDGKEIYAEAKATGYDAAIIRKTVAARRDLAGYRETRQLVDTYLDALDAAESRAKTENEE